MYEMLLREGYGPQEGREEGGEKNILSIGGRAVNVLHPEAVDFVHV